MSRENATEDANAFIVIGISVPPGFPELIRERVRDLDLNRSQYVRKLVREDLEAAEAERLAKASNGEGGRS